jgi:cytidine deaminase
LTQAYVPDLNGKDLMDWRLTAADAELVRLATELVAAHGDGVNHTVAAAARAADGRIVTGLNAYHFTGGPCAEQVVIGAAAAMGIRELTTIVAANDQGRGILSPCGRCRQVLVDYFPDIKVIVPTGGGSMSVTRVSDLLPWGNRWTRANGSQPLTPPQTRTS